MLQNWRIRTKILFGFIIVIALLATLAVVTFIGNLNTNGNLASINSLSSFQAKANDFLYSFYDARIGANIVYVQSNQSEYDRAVSSNSLAVTSLNEMKAMTESDDELSVFASELNTVIDGVTRWQELVDTVDSTNKAIDGLFEEFSTAGTAFTTDCEEIYDSQYENLESDMRASKGLSDMLTRRERVRHSSEMLVAAHSLRRTFLHMVDTRNVSSAEAALSSADTLMQSLQKYTDESLQQTDKDEGNAAMANLSSYIDVVSRYVAEVERHDEAVATAKAEGSGAVTMADKLMTDIDAAVSEKITSSVASGNTMRITAIVIALIAVVIGVFMALLISGTISKPIVMMARALSQIGTEGSLELAPDLAAQSKACMTWKDEIGECTRAVNVMLSHFTDIENTLKSVAAGDLTSDVKVLSERDAMGLSLQGMLESLNSMFGEIGTSTDQVSAGSKQIADGAQALAQGSTEQAAAVEELSSSISEIADKTRTNAQMAEQAASLANNIMSSAEKGSRQMDEMMQAVKEINDASLSINKVIKVIDDIAFQTNILALNAAVEAARAGQHGKGFAVVAEEVRNLAGKSAEAAKETDVLIANSIDKAQLGARIANDTAASLNEIVSGIGESTRLVGDIAKSSDEQSAGIGQINQGIEQVAQVVQQNSATAEESAAASEEMSGQAEMLQSLIAQFKIK